MYVVQVATLGKSGNLIIHSQTEYPSRAQAAQFVNNVKSQYIRVERLHSQRIYRLWQ